MGSLGFRLDSMKNFNEATGKYNKPMQTELNLF